MENTLQKIDSYEDYSLLKGNGFTAHDYQTSAFVQDLIPFLLEVQNTLDRQQREIEFLGNRVAQLDSFI